MSTVQKATKPRIADIAADMLRARSANHVMWGDGLLVDIGVAAGVRASHPLGRMEAVLAGLARAPTLFEPRYVRGHDNRGRARLVRGFKLIEAST